MIDSTFCNELKRQVFLIIDPVLAEAEGVISPENFNVIQLRCLELIQSVEEFVATFSVDLGEEYSC